MDVLYIVVPAYNESENIEQFVKDWYPIVERHNGDGKSRLVVIDDGSHDNTYDLLEEMAKTRPYLLPMTKPNSGHGPTVLYGYRYAVESGADYVFQTDSDGQTNPKEFERFWQLRTRYDAVIGTRPDRGDGKSRLFVEKTLVAILQVIFGVKVPDANAPYRLMERRLLEKYLKRIPEDYKLPNVMLTVYFAYYRESMIFRRISFRPRQGGKNSLNMQKIAKIGTEAIKDFHTFRKQM